MTKHSGKNRRKSTSSSTFLSKENLVSATMIVLVSIGAYATYINATKKSLNPPVPSPSLQSVEKNIHRVEWLPHKPFASYLDIKGVPVVLRNSVAATFPPWTISDIAKYAKDDPIQGFYRSDSGFFGPYYDPSKPMAVLSTAQDPEAYTTNASLPKSKVTAAMTKASKSSPYYALSASLSDVSEELEGKLDLKDMIAMMPSHSSVNVWLGAAGVGNPLLPLHEV
jgi:hypothetical protein